MWKIENKEYEALIREDEEMQKSMLESFKDNYNIALFELLQEERDKIFREKLKNIRE